MKLFKMDELEIPGNEDDLNDESEFDTPLNDLLDYAEDDSELNIPLADLVGNDPYENEFGSVDNDAYDDEVNTPLIDLVGRSSPEIAHKDEDDFALFSDDEGMEEEGYELEQEQDDDYQGIIRTVKGAYLIYKRKQPDDTYEELWIYNVGKDLKQENQTRRAILAGTDIDPSTQDSNDSNEHAEASTLGNVQFLLITNLPN